MLDEVLLFDQALSGRESAAREKMTEMLADRARRGEDRQALLDDTLTIVLDPDVGDDQVGARLRGDISHEPGSPTSWMTAAAGSAPSSFRWPAPCLPWTSRCPA